MTPPVRWQEHADDTTVISRNIAALDVEFMVAQGHRDPFTADLPREWHTRIHAGCVHIPRTEYVGHYRGEQLPHVRVYTVGFGRDPATGAILFHGAPPGEVAALLTTFANDLDSDLARWDARIPSADQATLARLNDVVGGLARHYATWLRIHPFADGNGRTARLLVNWVMARYWQPPILPGRPVSNRDQLVAVTSTALPEATADYRALTNHLRARLKDARMAASRST